MISCTGRCSSHTRRSCCIFNCMSRRSNLTYILPTGKYQIHTAFRMPLLPAIKYPLRVRDLWWVNGMIMAIMSKTLLLLVRPIQSRKISSTARTRWLYVAGATRIRLKKKVIEVFFRKQTYIPLHSNISSFERPSIWNLLINTLPCRCGYRLKVTGKMNPNYQYYICTPNPQYKPNDGSKKMQWFRYILRLYFLLDICQHDCSHV